jgi:hypothetical protein
MYTHPAPDTMASVDSEGNGGDLDMTFGPMLIRTKPQAPIESGPLAYRRCGLLTSKVTAASSQSHDKSRTRGDDVSRRRPTRRTPFVSAVGIEATDTDYAMSCADAFVRAIPLRRNRP